MNCPNYYCQARSGPKSGNTGRCFFADASDAFTIDKCPALIRFHEDMCPTEEEYNRAEHQEGNYHGE